MRFEVNFSKFPYTIGPKRLLATSIALQQDGDLLKFVVDTGRCDEHKQNDVPDVLSQNLLSLLLHFGWPERQTFKMGKPVPS